MRVLYISDRQDGGMLRHVRTIRACLPEDVVSYEIGVGGDEELAGNSGHSFKEFLQIRSAVKRFKPDLVHLHLTPFMMSLYLRLFTKIPRIVSLHAPTVRPVSFKDRFLQWLVKPCYYLPVSAKTWAGFKEQYTDAQGEVFYNPLRISPPPPQK